MLGETQRHRQACMQQAKDAAGQRRNQQAGPEIGAVIDGKPADHCAEGHDAFNAEIEHARPLAEQSAERAENQRRGDP